MIQKEVKTPNGSRIEYIDVAKAICIFLMVVGHWNTNETLAVYIYSFHMPALFLISGYLYKPHTWYKTIICYAIPIVFFAIVNIIIELSIGGISMDEVLKRNTIFRIFHYRYGLGDGFFIGDWFLYALMAIRFLMGDVSGKKMMRKYYIPIGLLAILYMTFENQLVEVDTIFRDYYVGRAVPCLPFFRIWDVLKRKAMAITDVIKVLAYISNHYFSNSTVY